MEIQLLKHLQTHLSFFETDELLLGKIKGCTEQELQQMDAFYDYKVPQVIRELFFLGGHNFFDFYFQLEYSTGYRLWQRLIHHNPNEEELFLSVFYSYTQRIVDLGLRIAESIDNQRIPQSAIPNPKSVVYILSLLNALKFIW